MKFPAPTYLVWLALLAGCQPAPPATAQPDRASQPAAPSPERRGPPPAGFVAEPPVVVPPLDALALHPYGIPGTLAVTGTSLVRFNTGAVRDCAGQAVYLVPGTPPLREMIRTQAANAPNGLATQLQRPPLDNYVRRTVCDAQGRFRFDGLAPGDWVVYSVITWADGTLTAAAVQSRLVQVQPGADTDVTMNPERR